MCAALLHVDRFVLATRLYEDGRLGPGGPGGPCRRGSLAARAPRRPVRAALVSAATADGMAAVGDGWLRSAICTRRRRRRRRTAAASAPQLRLLVFSSQESGSLAHTTHPAATSTPSLFRRSSCGTRRCRWGRRQMHAPRAPLSPHAPPGSCRCPRAAALAGSALLSSNPIAGQGGGRAAAPRHHRRQRGGQGGGRAQALRARRGAAPAGAGGRAGGARPFGARRPRELQALQASRGRRRWRSRPGTAGRSLRRMRAPGRRMRAPGIRCAACAQAEAPARARAPPSRRAGRCRAASCSCCASSPGRRRWSRPP